MLIHGLQKMTLLDYPGYVACTVFLNGCDFRCPYCHNFELVDGTAQALMDDEEFFAFLGKRKGLLPDMCRRACSYRTGSLGLTGSFGD